MTLSDWNLEASEELGMLRTLQEEARRCSKGCNSDLAKNGACHRYCNNSVCTEDAKIEGV